ncbi:MAG: hypothetical protein HOV77_16610 [Hamadaea sp.]|uniref:hypothetical protein n=1 Tax=Hamadaea sp. TaxID=2024425 RepID=UPI00181D8668|nr:hypothetical protein [Hamadaea sp.]NUT20805.1 hypothetical protein [Hamadaea sp.]
MSAIRIIALLAAVGAGYFGGWMVAWTLGDTVSATVHSCHVAYGWNESRYAECVGDWRHDQSEGGTNISHVGSGPVIGLDVDPTAGVIDSDGTLPGDYAGTYFARLDGRAAIVIPRSHLLLGPTSVVMLTLCGVALIVVGRRHRGVDRSRVGQ